MLHDLTAQIVKQVGIVVIGYVGEVDQAADDIIFRAIFEKIALRHADGMPLISPQILRPECFIGCHIGHAAKIKREGPEPRFDLSFG
ncbi:hypothetical protein BV87_05855 [Sphingobium yanoikuyae]|uniref:Uncharacterized protein n=1 Tax=Sphingobium yanoikuyae TaxID=13690 RepID=A0A0J9CZR5_SPHYA|nr:hypothetical protein BV87_05855 [Sphingobium yanoikuyae]KMW30434.1 hypothetical protein BV87_05725 [Sphingobium yanoikuyae]